MITRVMEKNGMKHIIVAYEGVSSLVISDPDDLAEMTVIEMIRKKFPMIIAGKVLKILKFVNTKPLIRRKYAKTKKDRRKMLCLPDPERQSDDAKSSRRN